MPEAIARDRLTGAGVVAHARALLGAEVHTFVDGSHTAGRIVETEAYRGADDKAAHSYGHKRTKRTEVFFGPPGHAYVYLVYGLHQMFNIVTGPAGQPDAVLVRAIEPIRGTEVMLARRGLPELSPRVGNGPALVCQALGITRAHYGLDLLSADAEVQLRGVLGSVPDGDVLQSHGSAWPTRRSVPPGPGVFAKAAICTPLRPYDVPTSSMTLVSAPTATCATLFSFRQNLTRLLYLTAFVSLVTLSACGGPVASGAQTTTPPSGPNPLLTNGQGGPVLPGVGEWLDPRLRSLKFTAGGDLSDPFVPLDGGRLSLTFDWLEDDVKDFRYDVVHCDRNWQPDRLSTIDYLQTFSDGDITDFRLSVTTANPYTSYALLLPNQYVAWKVSGNYFLRLYDDNTGKLIARLRFCVYEDLLNITPQPKRPTQALLDRTHQEFNVSTNIREARVEDPRRSLTLTVIQNGDWRYAYHDLLPRRLSGEDAVWDYPGKLVFPGHREWRSLDIRTLLSDGGQVEEVVEEDGGITVYLAPNLYRVDDAPEVRLDVNGKFVLGDFDNRLNGRSDYATTIFALRSERDPSIEPLYLYGAYNGYQLSEANRGVYNDLTRSYVFRALLRQGFYDYAYVSLAGLDGVPSWAEVEGNTFSAENHYNFLLYYRPYGARYDRLIGYRYFQIDPTGTSSNLRR